jgi:hypothetical protein
MPMMNDSRAAEMIRRHEALKSARGNWNTMWQEIADRILPRQAEFVAKRSAGEKRTERQFDSTAPLALERFAAAMASMLTPSTQMWHRLRVLDDDLNEDHAVRVYLDEVNKTLFRARYRPASNFSSQLSEVYMSLGAFGTGAILVDEFPGLGLVYKAIHLAEIYVAENAAGRIDTVHREYEYTARQIAQRFGTENLPDKIKAALERQDDQSKYTLIHCVKPNEDRITGRMDYRGRPIASYDILLEGNVLLRESGYRTMPYAVSRYVTSAREVYGRGPAATVLPDIKMVNEMEKTTIRMGHRAVDPPLLLQSDGALTSFQATPGALNWGGMDDSGNPAVRPLETGGNLPFAFEMIDAKRKVIQDAFLVTLFQILIESPSMTATEALLRAQEKGALLAPTMGRQQTELLGPIIERELDILGRAGQLPEEVPEALIELGGQVDVEYTSPLARLQRSEDGVAILRTIEAITPIAQVDPSVLDNLDPDAIVRELAEINGAPSKILRDKKMVEQVRAQRSEQADATQLLEAAPVAANAAKSLAQAEQIAQQIPRTVLPEQIGA